MKNNQFVEFDYLYDEEPDSELPEETEPTGNRHNLLCMYLYDILKTVTSPCRKLTQEELIARLDQFPYSLSVERKAVGRALKTLVNEGIGIHTSKNGAWFELSARAA